MKPILKVLVGRRQVPPSPWVRQKVALPRRRRSALEDRHSRCGHPVTWVGFPCVRRRGGAPDVSRNGEVAHRDRRIPLPGSIPAAAPLITAAL